MKYTKKRWNKVSRTHRCPICGKPDWCLFSGPAGNPDAAICARVESTKIVGTKGAGWLHRLRSDDDWRDRPRQRRVRVEVEGRQQFDFATMAAECEAALGPHALGLLAAELGVSADSLSRLQVGWSRQHKSFSFAMRDAAGNCRGIRLRRCDGSKLAVKGSRQGLFIPRHFPVGETLVVCEGPTDTAAMLMLCFDAIGRPSCNGCENMIVDLVLAHHFENVVIIADHDCPGQRGARSLAARLVGYIRDGVRIVTPPAKDAREWIKQGADRLEVLDAIEQAPVLQLRYGVRGGAL